MKRVMLGLLVLVLSSLVVAQSSEIVTEFNVGRVDVGEDYVAPMSFWSLYGSFIIGLVIVIIIVIAVALSKKKVKRKKVVRKKVKKKKR